MFIDKVEIYVKAGKGGNGAIAFHREKYIEKGGPSGGDGGRGGSVFLVGKSGLTTLIDFRYNRKIIASDGENGQKEKRYGKSGEDIYKYVPVGTIVKDKISGRVIADIIQDGQIVQIARGGKGGKGNAKFASSRNQTPRIAENGDIGEEYDAVFELKLLADVGLVGFPSVGKSTLLSVLTNAKPEIADYHFTTLRPNLGVVSMLPGYDFVIADLPGLIEGASQGKGLGLSFLKHIERCRVILHVIDMSSTEQRDPYQDYLIINKELEEYGLDLEKRPMVIAANKMDEDVSWLFLEEFKKKVGSEVEIFPISAMTRFGLEDLIKRLYELVQITPKFPLYDLEEETKVYELKNEDNNEFFVKKEGNVWTVYGDNIKRIYSKINLSEDAGIMKLLRILNTIGVEKELVEQGIEDQDTVKIEDFEFTYYK